MSTVTILPTWRCYRFNGNGRHVIYVKAADFEGAVAKAREIFKRSGKRPRKIFAQQVTA